MALESFYKGVMALNGIQDMAQREIQAKTFFKELNSAELPRTVITSYSIHYTKLYESHRMPLLKT